MNISTTAFPRPFYAIICTSLFVHIRKLNPLVNVKLFHPITVLPLLLSIQVKLNLTFFTQVIFILYVHVTLNFPFVHLRKVGPTFSAGNFKRFHFINVAIFSYLFIINPCKSTFLIPVNISIFSFISCSTSVHKRILKPLPILYS